MLGWFRALMPKEGRFFDLFERHAGTLVEGAAAIERMLAGETIAEACRDIARHESAADDTTREALLTVRRAFITPFESR